MRPTKLQIETCKQNLESSIVDLELLISDDDILSRWSFDEALDKIATALAEYVRITLLTDSQPNRTTDEDALKRIGCSLLYRTLPENCYVGGASTDRRMMEFDARHYALPEDWLDSVTAFSMSANITFVLDDCGHDWWPMTMRGLEHHQKDCETAAQETASFYCYPIGEQPSEPRKIRNAEQFNILLEQDSQLAGALLEDRGLRLMLRDGARTLDRIISTLDLGKFNARTVSELKGLKKSNEKLHQEIAEDLSMHRLLEIELRFQEQRATLDELEHNNQRAYYKLKPENRLQDLALASEDRVTLYDEFKKDTQLRELLENPDSPLSTLLDAESQLTTAMSERDDLKKQFLNFKSDDSRQKRQALRMIRAERFNSLHPEPRVAAVRLTSTGIHESRAIEKILEDDQILSRIRAILVSGREKIGSDKLTNVALRTLADLFKGVPDLDRGEYYALDRLTSYLQALFGGCEVSVFEAHSGADTDMVELWLAATTALSQKMDSQHYKFRQAFRDCRPAGYNQDQVSVQKPLYYQLKWVPGSTLGQPKTVRAYLSTPKVFHEEEDTVSKAFSGMGEIVPGDTRSFLAFGIPAESAEFPYGVIRIVSGKKEHFSETQLLLARAVAEGLAIMWKFFPKNESLEFNADQKTMDEIRGFVTSGNPMKISRFEREFDWLMQKVFAEASSVRVSDVSMVDGRLVFKAVTDEGNFEVEVEGKPRGRKYEKIAAKDWRETRTLKGLKYRIEGAPSVLSDHGLR